MTTYLRCGILMGVELTGVCMCGIAGYKGGGALDLCMMGAETNVCKARLGRSKVPTAKGRLFPLLSHREQRFISLVYGEHCQRQHAFKDNTLVLPPVDQYRPPV
jgi:hypothetical protein